MFRIFLVPLCQILICMKKSLSLLFTALISLSIFAQQRFVGGDISLLPQYEQHNSAYKDVSGKKIDDLLKWFVTDCGWNTFRVRLFVHPDGSDPSVCQDLAYVTALGKRIKEAGAYFMLDFHYSDTWVDALHIQAPMAWQGASDAVMADSVASFTRLALETLIAAGAQPDLVQVGNEIMYGLCGIPVHPYSKQGDNWDGYLGLLRAGCNVVRELCPKAQIIIHTDRPTNTGYNTYYYQKLIDNGVDYDIIGLSYYPFWHGYMTPEQVASKKDKANLVAAINDLAARFPGKTVHIVECAYNFQYWPTEGANVDTRDIWPATKVGQFNFVRDLVNALRPLENVRGIQYWFPEEAGNGDDTDWNTSQGTVITTWLNRGFWDENLSTSGHAINRVGQVTSDKTPADVCAPHRLGTFLTPPTEDLSVLSTATQALTYLRHGCIVIERQGACYTLLGQCVE